MSALCTTIYCLVKKKIGIAIFNGILTALYSVITAVIYQHYFGMTVGEQFNDCMLTLQNCSRELSVSYYTLNLLIYVILFFGIILFHVMQMFLINSRFRNRKKPCITHQEGPKSRHRRNTADGLSRGCCISAVVNIWLLQ